MPSVFIANPPVTHYSRGQSTIMQAYPRISNLNPQPMFKAEVPDLLILSIFVLPVGVDVTCLLLYGHPTLFDCLWRENNIHMGFAVGKSLDEVLLDVEGHILPLGVVDKEVADHDHRVDQVGVFLGDGHFGGALWYVLGFVGNEFSMCCFWGSR